MGFTCFTVVKFFSSCQQLVLSVAAQDFGRICAAGFQDLLGKVIASFDQCDDIDMISLAVACGMACHVGQDAIGLYTAQGFYWQAWCIFVIEVFFENDDAGNFVDAMHVDGDDTALVFAHTIKRFHPNR